MLNVYFVFFFIFNLIKYSPRWILNCYEYLTITHKDQVFLLLRTSYNGICNIRGSTFETWDLCTVVFPDTFLCAAVVSANKLFRNNSSDCWLVIDPRILELKMYYKTRRFTQCAVNLPIRISLIEKKSGTYGVFK